MRDPRLDNDPDFIVAPRYNNSLRELLKKHPDGVSDNVIQKCLDLTAAELEQANASILSKLRGKLGVV
jgi:hypothetical protein